ALAGDLSMLHDVGALATAARLRIPVTVVVVNNDGGGIFHLLPQAGHPSFERHWGTPHGLDFTKVAAAFGVEAEVITERNALAEAVATTPDRPRVLELRTDRVENAGLHRAIRDAVGRVLA
ncbi:MAG TPA: thiamine pyrophosphate-dependent enzyme, partial [Acidimicrobiia bacterium]|nr:thiamine pyrophosphate-dependent enzyme [Acidimicrobiia bacterium]